MSTWYTALRILPFIFPNFIAKQLEDIHACLPSGWTAVETSSAPPTSKYYETLDSRFINPDITLYSSRRLDSANTNAYRTDDMETFILTKPCDGFSDSGDVEKDGIHAQEIRGQLITYLTAMQASQYRTHGFGALIVEDRCRLLHHNRRRILVTESFSLSSPYLSQFFWCFSRSTPAVRGIDTTFTLISNPSDNIRHMLNAQHIWEVNVGGAEAFLIGEPFTTTHTHALGRGTRCFIALDASGNKCVLKDVWRIERYHPEGETYAKLHEAGVQGIPRVVQAGDAVDEVGAHRCGRLVHYRIVLGVVGRPLTEFRSTYELCSCMLDILKGTVYPSFLVYTQ